MIWNARSSGVGHTGRFTPERCNSRGDVLSSRLRGRENLPSATGAMAEKLVLVGVLPEAVILNPGEQVVWFSDAGNLKIEFDPKRCPFSSNVLQAPTGVRLLSGTARPGHKPGSYRYRISLNDQVISHGEVIVRKEE